MTADGVLKVETKYRKSGFRIFKLLLQICICWEYYVLIDWVRSGRTGKYLARGPYVLTERQIFSCPARPYSVNKHFIIWPLNCWKFWKFCLNLNRTRLHNIRRPPAEQPQKRFYNKNLSFISSRRTRNAQFIEKHDSFSHICFSM